MRVLVAFKIVPNLEDLTESDWEIGPNLTPELTYARPMVNPDDESALELALRLRDARGKNENGAFETYLSAVTLGDTPAARRISQTLMALGFSKVGLVGVNDNGPFAPDLAARYLSPWAGGDFHLILTGQSSADGQNGLTSKYLARLLGYELISEVVGLKSLSAQKIEVESLTDDGLLRQTLAGPTILSVGNAPSAFLRVPTLKDRLKYSKAHPELLPGPGQSSGADFPGSNLPGPNLPGKSFADLVSLKREAKTRKTTLVTQGSAEDKAALILKALKDWGLKNGD
ncbi:MAG: hypothetical protein LBF38_01340 [Deltaproteobacteria bacterium]|jgi:electron transfer flavoprotein alpha/beta subunit|nr:hypothetical protein [Deltaproteobacteria bacterium]